MKFEKETHFGSTVHVPECKRCNATRATNQIQVYKKTEFDTYILLTVCDECYKEIKDFIFREIK